MHEVHQVEALVKELFTQAKNSGLTKINKVELKLGDGLGFDDTSIRLYFENFTEGTIAENAELIINHVPAELNCTKCHKNFVKIKSQLNCPTCGTQGFPTAVGKEFVIEKIS